MSQYKRNILVGVTVLAALVLLGWMILRFSDAPFKLFAKPQMTVTLRTSTAQGLSEGSGVTYKGVPVGRVVALSRTEDHRHVIVHCNLDVEPALPANLQGRIASNLFGGGSIVHLVLVTPDGRTSVNGSPTTRPPSIPQGAAMSEPPDREPEPVGRLQPNAQLIANYVGVDILPPEITSLASDLRLTSREVRAAVEKFNRSDIIPNLASTIDSVRKRVDEAGLLVADLRSVVNEANRNSIRDSLAQFNEASKTATRIAANLERLSANANSRLDEVSGNANRLLTTTETQIVKVSNQLSDRLAQTAGVLAEFEKAGKKINDGQGTAAQLLNNPALYEELLDTSRELKLTIGNLKRLVEQWEQEGVSFKLK
jgi:phospholipid/cholesterol/gamma-HCH transport system substrate-binding protein